MTAQRKKKPAQTVRKPFLTGSITDENTVKNVLKFFGIMLLAVFMSFIVCTMTSFNNDILRIGANALIVILILIIFYNSGLNQGTDAVARGEILAQRREKGLEVTRNEQKLCYHSMKGYFNAFCGTILFLIPAIILAFTAERQVTEAGVLPSWMNSMTRRSEIGDALISYTQHDSMTAADALRMIVRICIMPFISMAGSGNKDLLLTIERISPVLLLLPAAAYGTGYIGGKGMRTRVHTEIEENKKIQKRRELKERKSRNRTPRQPEQLN